MSQIQLSIVVPVLDEEAQVGPLLENLSRQEHVAFEVVVSDGGSHDATLAAVRELVSSVPFPLREVTAPRGRGRQMNVGAAAAIGEWLLFLHVDSRFENPRALMLALAAMRREFEQPGAQPIAGHFPLHFAAEKSSTSLAYYFFEAKSRLDLPDCVHGDQGYLMHRTLFEATGGFDEILPFLEDCQMADVIARRGRWVSLPAELETSPRRFEREGLARRQTLNALIMNFRFIGWTPFFNALPGLYSCQAHSGPLELLPFWVKVRELLGAKSFGRRLQIWYATGRYVRSQAWQLLFAWHCRRQFSRGQSPVLGSDEIHARMKGFERISDNPCGHALAALLVWFWFYLVYARLLVRYRKA